ncbi:MAG TPA: type II secretion system protein [Sumerlaeia bacterium]|nr:type II secretion system protein [Sumerlaeia bacterium]
MRLRKAFTLIELLFVVAVIAVLAGIAVPNFLEAQIRTKIHRTFVEMRLLEDALGAYALEAGDYPPNVYEWKTDAPPDKTGQGDAEGLLRLGPGPVMPGPRMRMAAPGAPAPAPGVYGPSPYPLAMEVEGRRIPVVAANADTLWRLTTPVAYIGYLPQDVFASRRGTLMGYWNFGRRAGAIPPGAEEETDATPRVLLISAGPSQLLDSELTSTTVRFLPYDATNGTTSGGDIYLCIP